MSQTAPDWSPHPERVARANLTAFLAAVRREYGVGAGDYCTLHAAR